MAHYALLNNDNIVTQVITGIDENELIEDLTPEEWYGNFHQQKCVRTSYNANIRKQYAGIGFRYDEAADVFISPKPYPSWNLDSNYDWQAPIELPADGKDYAWDEDAQAWVEIAAG